jgi:GDP-L-fucose synthase
MYSGKKVLVAGGTGTIGIPLVQNLVQQGAEVSVVSLDSQEYAKSVLGKNVNFKRSDLTLVENCLNATKGQDYVFNLVGIKGSVGIGETKVASYFVPMLRFQTNLMDASFQSDVDGYMFVSSVCIYPQASEHFEDNAWNGMPKQNDRIPGLAKRIGEIQGETYLKEYGWDAVKILRPSNVYGPFDDFNPQSAQVIPSLITRVLRGENPLRVWGDGSAIRDFIYSKEVAHWLLEAMIKAPPCVPINLGSGTGYSIKEVAETICDIHPDPVEIEWDTTKPSGDPIRIMNMDRAKKLLNFKKKVSLREGITETIKWLKDNPELAKLKGF